MAFYRRTPLTRSAREVPVPNTIHLILLLTSVKRYGMTERLSIEIERIKSSMPMCDIRYAYHKVYGYV